LTPVVPSASPTDQESSPLLVVTVGTDHHPFDRLVGWIDEWFATRRPRELRCLVQRGTSAPPAHVPSVEYLPYHDLEAALEEARAVVSHGGPGTIMLCVAAGMRPIVVPRRRDLGEHVDDHQVAFARRIAADGVIELAETREAFETLLDRALEEPRPTGAAPASDSVAETVERFEAAITALLRRRPTPKRHAPR
jgi:UDP-N-acetylglucosamine transferase subunit ALG13